MHIEAEKEVVTSGDFVDRQREMRELVPALDDALAGKGRLVMLVEESGIGKTRTAQELTTIAYKDDGETFDDCSCRVVDPLDLTSHYRGDRIGDALIPKLSAWLEEHDK